MNDIVAGKIFERIEIDSRVTTSLQFCLYCKIVSTKPLNDSRVNLIGEMNKKQCPFCKTIFILNYTTLSEDEDF